MAQHAILSASSSHRWLECTPSARLEQKFPSGAGVSAQEGTFAHALAELKLNRFIGKIPENAYKACFGDMKKNEFYSSDLEEYVNQYTDLVTEKYTASLEKDENAFLSIEQKLDFSNWVRQGFGTGDAVIISNNKIEIIDLKYGKNVPVSAVDNPQLRLYALGAVAAYQFLYDFETVQMTIMQLRNGGESTEVITVKDLLDWGENIVKPKAEEAYEGRGETKAGKHCKFCKAKVSCKAYSNYCLTDIESCYPKDPALLTEDEMKTLLSKVDLIKNYATSVKEYALQAALGGEVLDGYKVVEGRCKRSYSNEADIAKILIDAGYKKENIYQPQALLGLTAMEKLITKKVFASLVEPKLEKIPGKPTLVPVSDKRAEYNSAKLDFDVVEGD